MSKIICDICGTSYAETAKQCPICGSVRPGDFHRVTNEVQSDGKVSTGYTYVKGGRFSKSNVKKRTQMNATGSGAAKPPVHANDRDPDSKSNRGLVITAIVLLLAIIGVVIYVAIRFFGPISDPIPNNSSSASTTGGSQIDLSCTDLMLDVDTVLFEQVGEARLLSVTATPANTTDTITFISDNDEVATVSSDGKITAVGEGTAKITITCGNVTKECLVTCQFPEESSSDATEDTTVPDDTTKPQESIRLNRKDITFSFKGESWVLYSGSVPKNLITWSSDNESVATFVDGKVVAVGGGTTTVHAEFDGEKVSCIIRCSFKESTGVGGNGGVSEDGGGSSGNGGVSEDGGSQAEDTTYAIYTQYGDKTEDISISVGESVILYLKDSAGNTAQVTWSCNNSAVSVSGSIVKGVSKTSGVNVSTTYNGTTYTCLVRVG